MYSPHKYNYHNISNGSHSYIKKKIGETDNWLGQGIYYLEK